MSFHNPVLVNKLFNEIPFKKDGIFFDGTAGGGGHLATMIKKSTSGTFYAFDVDKDALQHVALRLLSEGFEGDNPYVKKNITVELHKKNFKYAYELNKKFDVAILDLGISSYQIDKKAKGFSYKSGVNLDMRMDDTLNADAKTVLNVFNKASLINIFMKFAEENKQNSTSLANLIINCREKKRIESSDELNELISQIYGSKKSELQSGLKRIYQAIRITVNDELGSLDLFVHSANEIIASGGYLIVITFHSLEEKVLNNLVDSRNSFKLLGILTPDEDEINSNKRARSAKAHIYRNIK